MERVEKRTSSGHPCRTGSPSAISCCLGRHGANLARSWTSQAGTFYVGILGQRLWPGNREKKMKNYQKRKKHYLRNPCGRGKTGNFQEPSLFPKRGFPKRGAPRLVRTKITWLFIFSLCNLPALKSVTPHIDEEVNNGRKRKTIFGLIFLPLLTS